MPHLSALLLSFSEDKKNDETSVELKGHLKSFQLSN